MERRVRHARRWCGTRWAAERELAALDDNFEAFLWLAILLAIFVMYVQRTRPIGGLDWFVMPIVIVLLVAAAVFGRGAAAALCGYGVVAGTPGDGVRGRGGVRHRGGGGGDVHRWRTGGCGPGTARPARWRARTCSLERLER